MMPVSVRPSFSLSPSKFAFSANGLIVVYHTVPLLSGSSVDLVSSGDVPGACVGRVAVSVVLTPSLHRLTIEALR